MSKKFTTRVFLVFGAILFLFVFVGCNQADNGKKSNPDSDELRVEPYMEHIAISSTNSFNAKVIDDKIYLNDIPYEYVSCEKSPQLIFNQLVPCSKDDSGTEEVLNQLKNLDTCYIIEAQSRSPYGDRLAIYEINGSYYFVRFFDNGEVMRIHKGTVNPEAF